MTDPGHRRALAGAVTGGLDLLVHNASALGPSPLPPLAEPDPGELESILRTNVVAPLALTQLLLPALRTSAGTVLSITSDAAVEPYPGWGGYGASKAALEQATAILGVEHPELTVHAVDPGDMDTAMHQAVYRVRTSATDRIRPPSSPPCCSSSTSPARAGGTGQRTCTPRVRRDRVPGGHARRPAGRSATAEHPGSRSRRAGTRPSRRRRGASRATRSACSWRTRTRDVTAGSGSWARCCDPATSGWSTPPRPCRPRWTPPGVTAVTWPSTSPAPRRTVSTSWSCGHRRRATRRDGRPGERLRLRSGAQLRLAAPLDPARRRLWHARFLLDGPVEDELARHGRPISYGYLTGRPPSAAYQPVVARHPGSAEMASAGRPLTSGW